MKTTLCHAYASYKANFNKDYSNAQTHHIAFNYFSSFKKLSSNSWKYVYNGLFLDIYFFLMFHFEISSAYL